MGSKRQQAGAMGGAPGIGSALAVGRRWDNRSRACCLNRRCAGSIRHRARRLADLRGPCLIADTQVSARRSTMEDPANRRIRQTGRSVRQRTSLFCALCRVESFQWSLPAYARTLPSVPVRKCGYPSDTGLPVEPRRTRRCIGQLIMRTLHQASLDPCRPGNGRVVRDRLDRQPR